MTTIWCLNKTLQFLQVTLRFCSGLMISDSQISSADHRRLQQLGDSDKAQPPKIQAFIPDTTASKTTTTTEATTKSIPAVISTNPTTTTKKILRTPMLIFTKSTIMKSTTLISALLASRNPKHSEIFKPWTHESRSAQTDTNIQGKPFYINETTVRWNTASMTTHSVFDQNATVPAEDNQSATFNLREITYLITGISVIEVFLTAIGIYIVKQRRMKLRNLEHEEINRKTTNPYSSLSRDGGNGNYEIIQLKNVSNDQSLQRTGHNECTYIEVIEHEYDYTQEDITPIRSNIL